MYKKITHTIVEEHFDHPAASQIKAKLDKKRSRIPTTETFNSDAFKTEVNDYFRNYLNKLHTMTASMSGTDEDFITAFESIYQDVDKLGNLIKHFYSSEFGERLNSIFRGIPILLGLMIHGSKAGTDTKNLVNRLNNAAIDLANVLVAYDNSWLPQPTTEMTTGFVSSLVSEVRARQSKDMPTVTKSVEQAISRFTDLGKLMGEKIVAQFPSRFTSSVLPTPSPTPMKYDSSIM